MIAKRYWFPVIIFILAIMACSIPGNLSTEDQIRTQIALTQPARATDSPLVQTDDINTAQTITLEPTRTPTRTITPTITQTIGSTITVTLSEDHSASDCNIATLIKDVTVPDGTKFSPGETFEKTWRLKNVGSCTWTTAYAVVFISGEQMNGPDDLNLTGNVAPGETVDVSITMTAPNSPGEYRGNWKLRSTEGVVFGLTTGSPFFVLIKVKN